MTEYTSSPDAVEEYMTAKDRTARWIHHNPPSGFLSPSAPPSELGDFDSDSRTMYESDVESVRSVPPKMVLKFGDGRPDIPISHWHYHPNGEPLAWSGLKKDASRSMPRAAADQRHRRSRSEQPQLRPGSRGGPSGPIDPALMHYPEEIRVLPSLSKEPPPPTSSSHIRQRSKSQPRPAHGPIDTPLPSVPYKSHVPHNQGPYPPIAAPAPRHVSHAPQVMYSHSHPMYRPKDAYASRYAEDLPHRQCSPPTVAFAQAPHPKHYYAPATNHPHGSYGPVPPGSRYPQGGMPFPSAHGGLMSVTEDMLPPRSKTTAPRERASSRVRKGSKLARSPSRESVESVNTYYVLPNQGQKVQIVAPDQSLYTATSTTQSPSTPQSGTSKKPFFSRFFGFGGGDKSASSNKSSSQTSNRRLHRRHSTGARGRPAVPISTR